MFAVPGWSVSADQLKVEPVKKTAPTGSGTGKQKRKRGGAKDEAVTSSNVANLWESVIEGKTQGKSKKASKRAAKQAARNASQGEKEETATPESKRRKQDRAGEAGAVTEKVVQEADDDSWDGFSDEEHEAPADQPPAKAKQSSSEKKDKARERKPAAERLNASLQPSKTQKHDQPVTAEAIPLPAPPSAPATPAPALKLTPLQASMREKLVSARFRHLNEALYTRPSAEALRMFSDSPESFAEYHEGFRRQVGVWPENPVDGYISDIQTRGKIREPPRDGGHRGGKAGSRHHKAKQPQQQQAEDGGDAPQGPPSLPRTHGTATIADLGCGDGRLASVLSPESAKLRLAIHSFDLQSPSPHITRADVADVPLPDGAVDVAIFCLALMGTNWLDFVEEAYRILRWKGELWIAEIASRFGPASRQKRPGDRVEHSVGNRQKKKQQAGKKGKAPGEGAASLDPDADREDLAVEVDGEVDRRNETDVSSFIEALRARGFVLQGEPDLSNKMFVKMLFVKAAAPVKGKCVREPPPGRENGDAAGGGVERQKKQKRFVWESKTDKDAVDEAAILKPCVYKIR